MALDKKNILIITSEFPPQPGGIGNHACNLALHLFKLNIEVEVIADQRSQKGVEESVFDKALPFMVTRIKRHDFRFRMYFQRFITTHNRLKKTSHAIATGKFSLWNVGLLSLFHKKNTLAVIHGSEVNFNGLLLRKSVDLALKRFNTIVAVSNYTKQLVSHLNLDIQVIPNGIDLGAWRLDGSTSIPLKGKPVLTTVGRVSSRKGQLNVIKQLPELIKQFPDLHYHCIGIPTEAEDFKEIAKDLNVRDHITFHGSVKTEVLKRMLNSTDIFVMLSSESTTGDVEGFGIAILEANALGVPAIGSVGCGIEDAIDTGVTGVLIDPKDGDAFKESIITILNAKQDFQRGAKRWSISHDWSGIIKQYIALLE